MAEKRKSVLVLLPSALKQQVRVRARENKRSMRREIEVAVERHVAQPAEVNR
jgi:hypothetical protein